jgi:hypothetical protein
VNTLETVRKRVQRARQSVDPIRLFPFRQMVYISFE